MRKTKLARISEELHAIIKRIAKEEKLTMSRLLDKIISSYLKLMKIK